ncbi:hypothetical protein [Clostridium tyrobutyricum]|uniref:hypothetical protein n=1 Tax=Clostridium tyrobutyricum TaxID=1519 RepID=UPI001FA6B2BD
MLKTKEAYLLFIAVFTACMSGLYLIEIVKDIGVRLVGLDVGIAANAGAMGSFRITFIVIGVMCIISSLILAFIKPPRVTNSESVELKLNKHIA